MVVVVAATLLTIGSVVVIEPGCTKGVVVVLVLLTVGRGAGRASLARLTRTEATFAGAVGAWL